MTQQDWLTLAIIPAAIVVWKFFETQIWPWFSKRMDADAADREEDEKAARLRQEARDERRVKAQEQTAQAMDSIGRTLAVMQVQIAAIERHTGMIPSGKIYPPGERERGGRTE